MTLFSAKYVIVLLLIVLGFGFYSGVLYYDKSKERCFQKRSWSHGTYHTFFAIGRMEFRVKDFGCDPKAKFDPDKYEKNEYGQIVPKLEQ